MWHQCVWEHPLRHFGSQIVEVKQKALMLRIFVLLIFCRVHYTVCLSQFLLSCWQVEKGLQALLRIGTNAWCLFGCSPPAPTHKQHRAVGLQGRGCRLSCIIVKYIPICWLNTKGDNGISIVSLNIAAIIYPPHSEGEDDGDGGRETNTAQVHSASAETCDAASSHLHILVKFLQPPPRYLIIKTKKSTASTWHPFPQIIPKSIPKNVCLSFFCPFRTNKMWNHRPTR